MPSLGMLEIVPSLTKPLTMVRKKAVTIPRNSAIQELASSSLTSKQLRQRIAPLLNNKELLRDVLGLKREDQKEFADKVDWVG